MGTTDDANRPRFTGIPQRKRPRDDDTQNPKKRQRPIPAGDTIERQDQHVPRYQDGGREANGGRITKHGGDLRRKDVDEP